MKSGAISRARRIHFTQVYSAVAAFIAAVLAVAVASAATATPRPVSQGALTSSASIQVMYRGHTVSYIQLNRTLGTTYCDDHLGPAKLTCYSSQKALELATLAEGGYTPNEATQVARLLGVAVPQRPTHPVLAASSGCYPYVLADLYTKPSRGGLEVTLYCDYTNFSTIGWYDRAQSGISPNCQAPLSLQYCYNMWEEVNYIKLELALARHAANMAAISKSGSDG